MEFAHKTLDLWFLRLISRHSREGGYSGQLTAAGAFRSLCTGSIMSFDEGSEKLI